MFLWSEKLTVVIFTASEMCVNNYEVIKDEFINYSLRNVL